MIILNKNISSSFSPQILQRYTPSQSSSIYDNSRNKTTASPEKRKNRYKLDYHHTLSSPKVQKRNEQFNSYYCNTPFDYYLICVSDFVMNIRP